VIKTVRYSQFEGPEVPGIGKLVLLVG